MSKGAKRILIDTAFYDYEDNVHFIKQAFAVTKITKCCGSRSRLLISSSDIGYSKWFKCDRVGVGDTVLINDDGDLIHE